MLHTIQPFVAWVVLSALGVAAATPEDQDPTDVNRPVSHTIHVFALFKIDLKQDTVRLIARSKDSDTFEVSTQIVNEGPHILELPANKSWELKCQSTRFWCPTVEISTSQQETSSTINIFPAANLTARLLLQPKEDPPDTIIVQGWLSVDGLSDSVASFVEEVKVDESGGFGLRAPEGPLDLRVSAKGRAPVYLWGLKAAGSTTLKPIALEKGSSIAGFAWDGVEDLPAAHAAVAALPAGVTPDLSANRKLERLAATAQTTDRGFFQIDGLLPGVYRLEVSAEDRSTQIVEQIEVREDSETMLDGRIVLTEPLLLDVHLEPPTPGPGEHWTVRLAGMARSVSDKTELQVQVDSMGYARVEGLNPQNYLFQILHPSGSTLFTEEKYIDADNFLEIELPVVGVEGTLALNDEPLGASVSLEAGFKDRTELVADSETGEFAGIVRRPDWKILIVRIRADEPDFRRRLIIENPEIEDGVIKLDLDLIGVDVAGDVVDRDGDPVYGAVVRASGGSNSITTRTSSGGSFTLNALDAGFYELQAEHPEGNSEIFPVELTEDRAPSSVRLVLQEKNEIQAVLRTLGGKPIRQARITAYSAGAAPMHTSVESDIEGRFAFDITPGTSRVLLQILAPSQVMWSGCLPIDTGATELPMIVTLPGAPGGRLEVQTRHDPESNGPPDTSSRLVLVTSDHGFLEFNEVYNWSLMTGNTSTSGLEPGNWGITGLAAGEQYAVLRSSEARWKLAMQLCLSGPPPQLDWHYLPAGGSTIIMVERSSENGRS